MPLAALTVDECPDTNLLPEVRGQRTEDRGQTSVAIRESCGIRKRVEDVEDVPTKVRAKQQEIVKFLKLVLEDQRRTDKGREECCLLIQMNYVDAFPILSCSGQGGSSQLTYNNCRNWLRLLGKTKEGEWNFANSAVLCDNHPRGTRDLKDWNGDPEFWKAFWGFFMNRNCLAATTAYRLAVMKTKKDNPFAQIPKFCNVQYRIGQMHPAELALARRGEEALKDKFICHIDRDWDAIQPGFMLVADNRQFDVFVRIFDEEKKKWMAVRPWICAAIDGKSWYLESFIITTEDINNDTIATVLGNHIHANGNRPPLVLYVDNGKDFNAQGFSKPVELDGYQHSTFIELCVNTLNSIPFNAKAKTVESYFKNMMREFDKLHAAYLGSTPGERPDTAAFYQKNPEKLLSVDQFTQVFGAWLDKYQGIPKHGKIHKGKSPREMWESRIPLSEPLTDARLFMAFLKPYKDTRKVQKGPSVRLDNNIYYSEDLWPLMGKDVMVKTDRYDDSHVYAFHTDGRFICECLTEELIKAYATDPESRKRISEGMARQRRQIKNTYTAVNRLTGGLHVLSPGELLVAAPDVQIIKDGEKTSIRGATHKFVRYIAKENGEQLPNSQDEKPKMLGPENPDMENRAEIEFKKNKKSAEAMEFQRKLDATLLGQRGGDEKQEKGDFNLDDFDKATINPATPEQQEEMRDEFDNSFN